MTRRFWLFQVCSAYPYPSPSIVRVIAIVIVFLLAGGCAKDAPSPGERDGQVHVRPDASFLAWDSVSHDWVSPEEFWTRFGERRRGKNWPSDTKFPLFTEVKEHDTILLQTKTGPCLMYFFHTRWRRANDVWRWAPEFNNYGGCPTVFDR